MEALKYTHYTELGETGGRLYHLGCTNGSIISKKDPEQQLQVDAIHQSSSLGACEGSSAVRSGNFPTQQFFDGERKQ